MQKNQPPIHAYYTAYPSSIMPVLKWPTFWAPKPTKLSAKEITGMTKPDIYKAGRQCYKRGGVVSAMIRRNLAWATVEDCGEAYKVVAPLDHHIRPYCPCMNGERKRACLHGVAALSHVSKMFDKMIQADPWKDIEETVATIPEGILAIFATNVLASSGSDESRPDTDSLQHNSNASWQAAYHKNASTLVKGNVRAVVVELLQKSDKARKLFAARFGEPDLPDHEECRMEISYMFDEACSMFDPPRVRLADFFKVAKARVGRGDIDEAILTYREITEGIMAEGVDINDEDGYLSSAFSRALDRMVVCIRRHLRKPAQRRPHIQYLHRRFVDKIFYWYDDEYSSALFKICTRNDDLVYLKNLHDTYLETMPLTASETRHTERMLEMRDALLTLLDK